MYFVEIKKDGKYYKIVVLQGWYLLQILSNSTRFLHLKNVKILKKKLVEF